MTSTNDPIDASGRPLYRDADAGTTASADDGIQHGIDDNPHDDAKKGAALGGVGGAVVGAMAGAMAGPIGAVIGAVVGGVSGAAASGAAVGAIDDIDNDNTVTGLGGGATADANRANDGDYSASETGAPNTRYVGSMESGVGGIGNTAPLDPVVADDRYAVSTPPLGSNIPGATLAGVGMVSGTGTTSGGDTRSLNERAADAITDDNVHDNTGQVIGGTTARAGEVHVPVTEETAEVTKIEREVGQVGVVKEADVETRHIAEPVERTRVIVEERDLGTGAAAATAAGAVGSGQVLSVPVTEEELVVQKVPHTRELIIRTEKETEIVEQDVTLRKERAEVVETGDVEVDGPRSVGSTGTTGGTNRL